MNGKEELLGLWIKNHLAMRKGIVQNQIPSFVEDAGPKVEAWFFLADKEITEKAISENYADLMFFIKKSDNEIAKLYKKKEQGESIAASSILAEIEEKSSHENASLFKKGLLVLLFLGVAYHLGKSVLTLAVMFIVAYYAYIWLDNQKNGAPVL